MEEQNNTAVFLQHLLTPAMLCGLHNAVVAVEKVGPKVSRHQQAASVSLSQPSWVHAEPSVLVPL